MEKGYKYLQMAGLALSVFVPALLLAGYSWRLGYVSTFGLNPEIISKGFSDVVVESWVVGVKVIAFGVSKWMYFPLFWVSIVTFLLGLLYFFVHLKNKGLITVDPAEITFENRGRKFIGLTQWHWKTLFETGEKIGHWFYWPLVVLIVAALLAVFPFEDGKQFALDQLVEHRVNGCGEQGSCTRLLRVDDESESLVVEGIVVAANSERIAIYSDGRVGVYPLLDDRVLVRGLSEGVVVELGELLGALGVK